ncbi:MAG: FmdE family protein [Coriobacteriia bacterium]|nr:FmdE family protein [Coriobacteriia bacterium]
MALKRTFDEDLEIAVNFHGHLCAGQVIGTRLCRIALEYFGIDEPETYRDLIAVSETDRCLADTLISVAHCHPGRRRFKMYDYGKMAASFYDIQSGKAIRIASKTTPQPVKGKDDVKEFFLAMPIEDLFTIQVIELPLTQYDLPGKSRVSVECVQCGEKVTDGRFIDLDGDKYCQTCAFDSSYYRVIHDLELH